jgi:hypothetical protein
MDYKAHYDRLIDRAKNRVLGGYVEVHHVFPKCLGGSDEAENLVQLTAEEHFVAHQLLVKIYPENKGLAYSVQAMTAGNKNQSNKGRSKNKLFGWLRKRYAQAQKGRVKSEQERKNIAEAGRNRAPRKFSEQARLNMAEARRKTWEQRRLTGEDKLIAEKVRATRIANGSYALTEEQRAAISKRQIGRVPWNKGLKLKQV